MLNVQSGVVRARSWSLIQKEVMYSWYIHLVLRFLLMFFKVFFTNLSVCFFIFLLFVLKCFYVVSSTWVARISGALGSLGTTRHT